MNSFALAMGGAEPVPGWLVVAVAATFAVAVFVLLQRAQSYRLPALLLVVIGVLVLGYAIVVLSRRAAEEQALKAEAQALSIRATALDGSLAASGLACVDALDDMAAHCEDIVFARPQTVAATRALVRARLMLLRDADTLLRRAPAADVAALVEVWRQPLARDPFGLVAVVLREDFSCADGTCTAARLLGEGSRAAENESKRTFETLYAAHAARWSPPATGAPSTISGRDATPATPEAPAPRPPESSAPPEPEIGAAPAVGETAPAIPSAAPAEAPAGGSLPPFAPSLAPPLPAPRPTIPSDVRPQGGTAPAARRPAPVDVPAGALQ
ncbi:hypothetical protein [Xanthobacter agilis]|uniref:Uncharacterized protein n=1 Tax=Xanthobacter agilis TaxID=47492 RepID=A0ABU0LB46_XANAG|nr:hypothetical protein [Xanthobacter agilis]MDQ0504343.1 hypothetical protein [Xanthobacter agilis]